MLRWVIPGLFLVLCIAAYAKKNDADLTSLTIEQLFQVQVTSASRTDHKLSDTAAAVFVITQEDIRRSTATSIPELLRMVPGLSVARLTGNTWAITARGFNTQYAGKLLVMVDGRTVYDPTFSGVFWNVQGYVLEDIDHIEVIRGPGASVWGTNAVNGIINIITKSAENTVGFLVTATGGNEERGTVAARYGARFGHNTYYRLYSKFFNRGSSFSPGGIPVQDDWNQFRSGIRVDNVIDSQNSLMVQAEGYTDTTQQSLPVISYRPPQISFAIGNFNLAGGHFLTRWNHKTASGAEMRLQGYYSLLDVNGPSFFERRHTGDIDFQHQLFRNAHHNLLWGAGYRFTSADLLNQPYSLLKFDSPHVTKHYASIFAQDEIRLAADRLHLTIGSKIEYNGYTGFEVEPTIRALWRFTPARAIWGSVSRASRIPSQKDDSSGVARAAFPGPGGLPAVVTVVGNPSVGSEQVIAYEMGYRWQPRSRLAFDLATFYNRYTSLIGAVPADPFLESAPVPHLVLPLQTANDGKGYTLGTELMTSWTASSHLKLAAAYSFLYMNIKSPVEDVSSQRMNGFDPRHQLRIQASYNFARSWEADTAVRAVSALPSASQGAYAQWDARIGWHATESGEFSLGMQNLLNDHHTESAGLITGTNPARRSIYGKVTWRF